MRGRVRTGGRAAAPALALLCLMSAGADASPCEEADVLAFVGSHVRARSLQPLVWVGEPRELVAAHPDGTAVCGVWLRARNAAWRPGDRAGAWLWQRQDWSVRRIGDGYVVTLLAPSAWVP